jgi:hypothetical protein
MLKNISKTAGQKGFTVIQAVALAEIDGLEHSQCRRRKTFDWTTIPQNQMRNIFNMWTGSSKKRLKKEFYWIIANLGR